MYTQKAIYAIVIILVCQLSNSFVTAQEAIPAEVKDIIRQRVDDDMNISLAVGVINEDGNHFFSYGKDSRENGNDVDSNSVYEIGSITKSFTGTLLAALVEQGKVDLQDPVQKFLPDTVEVPTWKGQEIKLVHLANHSSGLPRLPDNLHPADPANPLADYSVEQLLDFIDHYELTRAPGSKYEYSNYATGLLGIVLGRSQNKTYEELLTEIIFKPLEMNSTGIFLTPKMERKLTTGHTMFFPVGHWIFKTNTLAGAGAILSTTDDMLNYLGANIGLVDSKLYPAMQLTHKNSVTFEGPVVGLGWHTMPIKGKDITWHNGSTGGFKSFAGFIAGENKAVVVLSNSGSSVDDIGLHLLNPAAELKQKAPSVALPISRAIAEEGIEKAQKLYDKLIASSEKYNFGADGLNGLGYYYLRRNEFAEAIAVFSMNVKAHPESFNVYDSLGEAYLKKGDTVKAIQNYQKAVDLKPDHQIGIQKLRELGALKE